MKKPFRIALPLTKLEDPHLSTDSHAQLSMRRLLFSNMTPRHGDTTGNAVCLDWEVDNEGRSWKFFVRTGLFFSKGKEIEAKDLVYSLKRASSPQASGQLYTVTLHEYIGNAEISVINRHSLRLVNPEPISDLPELLSDLAVVPEGWDSYADATGNSEWELVQRKEKHTVIRHRSSLNKARGPEYLEFIGEPSAEMRLSGIREGLYQMALDPPLAGLETLKDSTVLQATGWSTSLSVCFFIECTTPPYNKVEFRQALNYALNKEDIIQKVINSRGKALNGPFGEGHFARDPELLPYLWDPQKAKELMRSAGVPNGFKVELHAPDSIPDEGPMLAEFLAQYFRDIGLEPIVRIHKDRLQYAGDIAEKKLHGLFCFDSSPHSSYKVLHEKLDSRFAGTWWQGYHNEEVNKFISMAEATPDDKKRRKIYHSAYRILHEEAPWVFLYQPDRFWLTRKNEMEGLWIDSLGFIRAPQI